MFKKCYGGYFGVMKNKKKTIIISLVAIFLVAAIIMASFFFYFNDESSNKKQKIIIVRKDDATSDVSNDSEVEEDSDAEDTGDENSDTEDNDDGEDYNSDIEDTDDNFETEDVDDDDASETKEEDNTSDSEDTNSDDEVDDSSRPRRELYEKEEQEERYIEVFKPEYTVVSKKWDGPKGYVIVYPQGNKELKTSALKLKNYILEQTKLKLSVVEDSVTETEKEILIGKTNRKKGTFTNDGAFAVKLIGKALVFEGKHYVSVEKAVNAFISRKYKKGYVNTLEGKFDFSSVVKKDYEYVWGDEFDGTVLDDSKWGLDTSMAGTATMKLDKDNCIKVEDGRLKLSALHYFDETDPNVEYAVPFCVSTRYTMSFQYGYLEMKARVPFEVGAWPSLWSGTKGSLGPHIEDIDYSVEVDMFEVFASTDTLVPNTHKWYNDGRHTQGGIDINGGSKKNYVFEKSKKLSNEYHIYGFEWTPKTMTMYVDGKPYTSINITKSYDENKDMRGFTDPLMLKINNHLFVTDSAFKPYGGSTVKGGELPFEYFIDYIRLYQKPDIGNLYLGE